MNYVFLSSGILLLLAAILDLTYTTFSPFGAGKITNFISQGVWSLALRLCGRDGGKRVLQVVGILAIVLIIFVWFILIWLGSSLIFASDPGSIIQSDTKAAATLAEKVYFTGFTLSTLGVGDYVAATDGWRILSVTLSLAGFMLITTAISYMLPVLSADVQKKSLSRYIASMGNTPEEILRNHWIDGNFHSLELHLTGLMQLIITHSQQLLAYPILYCFHSANRTHSTGINIARLDEALSILLIQVPPGVRPSYKTLLPLRQVITEYLLTQKDYFLDQKEAEFSMPELEELQAASIPLLNRGKEINDHYGKLEKRRKLLGAMLQNEGWTFADIYRGSSPPDTDWDLDVADLDHQNPS